MEEDFTQYIHVSSNREELPEEKLAKVRELRKKRNELTDQSQEIQREIDQIFIEHAGFSELKGKNIKAKIDDRDVYLVNIKEVKRLFYSDIPHCRIECDMAFSSVDEDFYIFRDYDTTITSNFEIVLKDELIKFFKDKTFKILSTLDSIT